MLILGPPRSGKTSSIVIPCVLDAPAAVVSTSTKPDVLAATHYRRWALGNCFVFDPSGTTPVPDGAYPLRWSPVVGCHRFEAAVSMAHALATAARPGSALSESAHWVERAEALLGPLLFAAALGGRDMATLYRWILARDLREADAVLADSGHELAQAVLSGVAQTEERERSGIFSTASGLLAAYRSDAALAGTRRPNFDPRGFARSSDTVYICAPAHAQDQLAPLVVALLEQIRMAVYDRPRGAAPVVFALDEVAGIAPLPTLPALAAEGGGQGLVTLACLQDLSQARARWGALAEGFFSIFNSKLVFGGIGDARTLQLISALAGETPVPLQSITHGNPLASLITGQVSLPRTTTSFTWRPRMPVDVVARGHAGQALRIASSELAWVYVRPWFQHQLWSAVARSLTPRYSEVTRTDDGS
jgi:type IV secretory pathway TraG/TraD family ATPase VirD4